MENKVTKKLDYINYFRAIAILIIVAGHSLVCGEDGKIKGIVSYLFDGGTYYFVFIAGFLFYYLRNKFEYLSYLKKKWVNVISPHLFIMLPGMIAFIFIINKTLNVLAEYSFGIFFMHVIIKDLFQKHLLFWSSKVSDLYPCNYNTLSGSINAIMTFLIMLLGSFIILYVIKKFLMLLKIKNTRMFIGV